MKSAAVIILASIAVVVAAILFNLAHAIWIDPWLARIFPWSTF